MRKPLEHSIINVILSCGYGRLHLAQSADCISKIGLRVLFVCGWVPKNAESLLVKFCSRIVGRNLSQGLRKRKITLASNGEVHSYAWADFMYNALLIVDRCLLKGRLKNCIEEFAWKVFGWQTKHLIRKVGKRDLPFVFHVRSGAGQGGAIREARSHGVKVLVDHSALHPAQTELNLKSDCDRWKLSLPIAPNAGVWKNVMKDCADADILMVNANHIRDSFVDRGYDPKKIRVVYLGVRDDFRDVTIRRVESGKKNYVMRVLFTGNFSLLKGAEYLLGSLRILNERGVKVHYDVVGAVSAPKAMLDHFNVDMLDEITFHGPVPQDNLRSFLAESDIYLFPSLADGCAQSGMEALTAGLPVVATYQSGLPIKDGETGCIVPMKNSVAIADKIEWLLANPRERERLGRNASEMMKNRYTWEKYAENVKLIYEELQK